MAAVTCASLAASLSLAADTAAVSCWLLGSSAAAVAAAPGCAVAAGVSDSGAAAAPSSDRMVVVGARTRCELLTCAAEAAALVSLSAAAAPEPDPSTWLTVLDLNPAGKHA